MAPHGVPVQWCNRLRCVPDKSRSGTHSPCPGGLESAPCDEQCTGILFLLLEKFTHISHRFRTRGIIGARETCRECAVV